MPLFLIGWREKLERSLACMLNHKVPTVRWTLNSILMTNPLVCIHILPTNFHWLSQDIAILCSKTHSKTTGIQVLWRTPFRASLQMTSMKPPAVVCLTTCFNTCRWLILLLFHGELFSFLCADCQNCPLIVGYCTIKTCTLTGNDRHPMDLTLLP